MAGVVYQPAARHECRPGYRSSTQIGPTATDFPRGTVWECECGQTWVSKGMQPPPPTGGYAAWSLAWKRESRRARRGRERRAAREQVGREGVAKGPVD